MKKNEFILVEVVINMTCQDLLVYFCNATKNVQLNDDYEMAKWSCNNYSPELRLHQSDHCYIFVKRKINELYVGKRKIKAENKAASGDLIVDKLGNVKDGERIIGKIGDNKCPGKCGDYSCHVCNACRFEPKDKEKLLNTLLYEKDITYIFARQTNLRPWICNVLDTGNDWSLAIKKLRNKEFDE